MAVSKQQIDKNKFSQVFLLIILFGVLFLCYLLFKPFLFEIILAAVLVTIFYPLYLKFIFWTRGMINLSALLMCLLIGLIIIIPISSFVYYLSVRAIDLYSVISPGISDGSFNLTQYIDQQVWARFDFINPSQIIELEGSVQEIISMVKNFLIGAAQDVIKSTTNFFVSFLIIIFTMFFLFRDGRSFLRRIMQLTPLSNKYDKLIWQKFKDVSYSAIVANLLTAAVQALVAFIGFSIVGIPPFLPSILIFFTSFLPYIGTFVIWLPISLYLLLIGDVWQGVFLIIWGSTLIGWVDNFLRSYLIKGKARVHPLIIFFSIFGGLILMGVWGLVFGPLVVALAVTILHIYELEFSKVLDK